MSHLPPGDDTSYPSDEPRFLAFFGRRRRTSAPPDQPKAHPLQEAWGLILLLAAFAMIGIVFFTHIFRGQ